MRACVTASRRVHRKLSAHSLTFDYMTDIKWCRRKKTKRFFLNGLLCFYYVAQATHPTWTFSSYAFSLSVSMNPFKMGVSWWLSQAYLSKRWDNGPKKNVEIICDLNSTVDIKSLIQIHAIRHENSTSPTFFNAEPKTMGSNARNAMAITSRPLSY